MCACVNSHTFLHFILQNCDLAYSLVSAYFSALSPRGGTWPRYRVHSASITTAYAQTWSLQ